MFCPHPPSSSSSRHSILTVTALPPYPPQIPRRRWPRHRPPHRLRSRLPRLDPRQSLLLHLPDPLLRLAPDGHLPRALHLGSLRQHHGPARLRLPARLLLLPTLAVLPHPLLLPRRQPPPHRGTLHRRALRIRNC